MRSVLGKRNCDIIEYRDGPGQFSLNALCIQKLQGKWNVIGCSQVN